MFSFCCISTTNICEWKFRQISNIQKRSWGQLVIVTLPHITQNRYICHHNDISYMARLSNKYIYKTSTYLKTITFFKLFEKLTKTQIVSVSLYIYPQMHFFHVEKCTFKNIGFFSKLEKNYSHKSLSSLFSAELLDFCNLLVTFLSRPVLCFSEKMMPYFLLLNFFINSAV